MAPTPLPTDLDATFADTTDASVKAHQQHHDRIHALLNNLTVDARDYLVAPYATTDNSAALAQAATDVRAAGGGTVLLPAGTVLGANIPLRTGVTWQGRGRGMTRVKLPGASTGHVFVSDDFALLDGGINKGGPHSWSMRDLTVDGNKGDAPTGGRGIASFSYEYFIEDVSIVRCKSDGYYESYQDQTNTNNLSLEQGPESFLSRLKVLDCDGNGLNIRGGHDSMAMNCIAARNALTNFKAGGDAWNWLSCHGWGLAQYAWHLTGENMLINCQAEGATIAQMYIDGPAARIVGGVIFFPGSPTATGLLIGRSTYSPDKCQVTGLEIKHHSSASGPAIDLTFAGPGLRLSLLNAQDTGTAVVGTPPADAVLDIQTMGAAANGNLFQRPGYLVSPLPTVPPLPPALYDHFTAADGTALDAARWTVATGGAAAASAVTNGNRARLTSGATGGYSATDRVFVISTLAPSLGDCELLTRIEWGATTIEGYLFVAVRASQADLLGGSGYAVSLANGNYDFVKIVNGARTTFTSRNYTEAGLSGVSTGSRKWLRLRVQGATISMKLWDDGTIEPPKPMHTVTDTSIAAGRVGYNLAGGNAAASSVFYVDNAVVTAA